VLALMSNAAFPAPSSGSGMTAAGARAGQHLCRAVRSGVGEWSVLASLRITSL
jgi:hypothetical protein